MLEIALKRAEWKKIINVADPTKNWIKAFFLLLLLLSIPVLMLGVLLVL